MNDVTRILSAIEQSDPTAAAQLLPLVYDELRRVAAHKLAGEKPGQTLEPTALVHEVLSSSATASETVLAPPPPPAARPPLRLLVTGADAGGRPDVRVIDPATDNGVTSFFAFDRNFRGRVRVAVGDVNGDGFPDIVAGARPRRFFSTGKVVAPCRDRPAFVEKQGRESHSAADTQPPARGDQPCGSHT